MAPSRQGKPAQSKAALGTVKDGTGLKKFFTQAANTPKPATDSSALTARSQASHPEPLAQPDSSASAPPVTPPQPATAAERSLTEADRQKMAENRRAALEKKKKRALEPGQPEGEKEPVHTSTSKAAMGRTPSRPRSQGKAPDFTRPTPAKEPIRKAAEDATVATGPSRFDTKIAPWMQYNAAYVLRLRALAPAALEQAKCCWDHEIPPAGFLESMRELSGISGEVAIVGVLVKDMKARSDIIAQVRAGKFQPTGNDAWEEDPAKLCTAKDTVWLEDEFSRTQLKMSEDKAARLVTGLVTCVRGMLLPDGTFEVTGLCWAGATVVPNSELPQALSEAECDMGPFVAFVSGLRIGSADGAHAAARERLLDFLAGQSSQPGLQALSGAVSRLIVCGGTYPSCTLSEGQATILDDVDAFFATVSAHIPVDVMPGRSEPTNLSMPQMPLLQHFFQRSKGVENFKSHSNPYEQRVLLANEAIVHILGHSGQPVDDILRCTQGLSPLQALLMCLEARHLAPSAPDTLPAQPFEDVDRFVIDSVPDVFFSGGHDKVEYQFVPHSRESSSSGTLCVCVPAFHKKPSVVLVNMRNIRVVRVVDLSESEDAPMN
mmetsp:Transcript_41840/g.75981  ORF Transcript_41840/g.75981 Transcript_41840/m.75981 type:complete len:604 (-) Transcript_41840:128-1939(-)